MPTAVGVTASEESTGFKTAYTLAVALVSLSLNTEGSNTVLTTIYTAGSSSVVTEEPWYRFVGLEVRCLSASDTPASSTVTPRSSLTVSPLSEVVLGISRELTSYTKIPVMSKRNDIPSEEEGLSMPTTK